MPTGVYVLQRVIPHVGIPVKVLGVSGLRHQRIGGDKAAQGGVVEADAVIVQAYCTLVSLACKVQVGGEFAGGVARLAVGQVALAAEQRAGIAAGDAGAAQASS